MRLKETCLIVIATAMLCMFAQSAMANSAISVEPVYMDVWQDEEFTVNITVDPAENEVYSASYTLHFDNTLLKAISWTQGEFLTRDGNLSNLWVYEIDNTLGKFEYGEGRIGTGVGVGGDPGNLTMITFRPRKTGLCSLNISDLASGLLYSTSGPIIPTDINNGSVELVVPSTPFMIHGYVSYENGSDCNDPAVNITNMDMGMEWTAGTSGNCYHLTLSSCADVIADEVLCFNVTSPDGSSNITEYTVTQYEVGDGGFELNITLEGPRVFDPVITYPVITSCNDTGAAQDGFCPGDSVWVKGTGLVPATEYKLWIQLDPVNDSDTLNATEDPSGSQETVTTGVDGSFGPIEIWSAIPAGSPMNYDIVVDNMNDTYNAADDGIDSAIVHGITAPIPELATFALIGVGLMLVVGLMRFGRRKR